MSVPPDQQVPEPHRRTLPHFPVNEQGMRELEIWIKGFLTALSGIFFGKKNRGRWLDIETTNGTNSPSGFDAFLHGNTLFLDYNYVTTNGNGWDFRTEGGGFSETTGGGGYLIDTGGGGYELDAAGVLISASGGVEIDSAADMLFQAATGIQLTPGANETHFLNNTKQLTVYDHNGNPILTLTG